MHARQPYRGRTAAQDPALLAYRQTYRRHRAAQGPALLACRQPAGNAPAVLDLQQLNGLCQAAWRVKQAKILLAYEPCHASQGCAASALQWSISACTACRLLQLLMLWLALNLVHVCEVQSQTALQAMHAGPCTMALPDAAAAVDKSGSHGWQQLERCTPPLWGTHCCG